MLGILYPPLKMHTCFFSRKVSSCHATCVEISQASVGVFAWIQQHKFAKALLLLSKNHRRVIEQTRKEQYVGTHQERIQAISI